MGGRFYDDVRTNARGKTVSLSALLQPQQINYEIEGLRVATVFERRVGADRLTVVLNGYCDRSHQSPPVFTKWPKSSDTFGHVLHICDPSLFLTGYRGVNASCFWGTEAQDPIPAVIECARKVSQELNIPPHRVVYFGHSGAGFGAMQCAIRDPEASGLAVNPILDPEQYSKYNFAKAMAEIFRENSQINELRKEFPERCSVIEALKTARGAGRKPCLGLIQNVLDKHHFAKHFLPFCRSVGIGPMGGIDETGLVRAKIYFLGGGHSGLPRENGMTERLFIKLLAVRSGSETQ